MDMLLRSTRILRKFQETMDTYCNSDYREKNLLTKIGKLTNIWIIIIYHPNDSIIENDQNTKKSPGDLRRLAVTQTLMKDHQLTLMWKTLSSKLAQREYKARHDWVNKVIHWEMCKKFKFDHTNKWYMHNPAPVLENATYKLL